MLSYVRHHHQLHTIHKRNGKETRMVHKTSKRLAIIIQQIEKLTNNPNEKDVMGLH